MLAGYAYPLYYNTLFAELRIVFDKALAAAKRKRPLPGYWSTDKTMTGVPVMGKLANLPPVWPKLWRRLQEYQRKTGQYSDFKAFLEQKNERVIVMSEVTEKGLQDLVDLTRTML